MLLAALCFDPSDLFLVKHLKIDPDEPNYAVRPKIRLGFLELTFDSIRLRELNTGGNESLNESLKWPFSTVRKYLARKDEFSFEAGR